MWLDYCIRYLFFVFELATIFLDFFLFFTILMKGNSNNKNKLIVRPLNKSYQQRQEKLVREIYGKKALRKKYQRTNYEKSKLMIRNNHNSNAVTNLFLINFTGDIKASQSVNFAEEVTSILQIAEKNSEALIKLESYGGEVHSYGLVTAHLLRIKEAGLKLTVSIDKIAASGGYMIASVADKIIASPFAIIGSIGVIGQLPNLHKFLSKKGIDVELHTSGKYKRTLTFFGKNTDEGRKKI